MRRVKWKPELPAHYCTGCRAVRELPPKGSNSVDLSRCKYCKTLVIDSLADTWTFLASSLAKSITEGHTPVGGWTLHSASSRRASIAWLQGLAENVINIWERSLLEDTSHLPTLQWSTAIREVTREEIVATSYEALAHQLAHGLGGGQARGGQAGNS